VKVEATYSSGTAVDFERIGGVTPKEILLSNYKDACLIACYLSSSVEGPVMETPLSLLVA
jgi:hypothetical protein